MNGEMVTVTTGRGCAASITIPADMVGYYTAEQLQDMIVKATHDRNVALADMFDRLLDAPPAVAVPDSLGLPIYRW